MLFGEENSVVIVSVRAPSARARARAAPQHGAAGADPARGQVLKPGEDRLTHATLVRAPAHKSEERGARRKEIFDVGLSFLVTPDRRVLVTELAPGGPAAKLGFIAVGDTIAAVDDEPARPRAPPRPRLAPPAALTLGRRGRCRRSPARTCRRSSARGCAGPRARLWCSRFSRARGRPASPPATTSSSAAPTSLAPPPCAPAWPPRTPRLARQATDPPRRHSRHSRLSRLSVASKRAGAHARLTLIAGASRARSGAAGAAGSNGIARGAAEWAPGGTMAGGGGQRGIGGSSFEPLTDMRSEFPEDVIGPNPIQARTLAPPRPPCRANRTHGACCAPPRDAGRPRFRAWFVTDPHWRGAGRTGKMLRGAPRTRLPCCTRCTARSASAWRSPPRVAPRATACCLFPRPRPHPAPPVADGTVSRAHPRR
jgi:hypothetical protein